MSRKIKVAIVGVGNCASSLVQGIYYYRDAKDDAFVPGVMHVRFGGYHIRDIEVVAAFDVNRNKVGKDVAEAIYAAPNNTTVFAEVPALGVKVSRGPRLDGVNKYTEPLVPVSDTDRPVDVVKVLKESGAVPMNLELRLSVEDSPNSAGVAIDSIRCLKLALDNKLSGAIIEPAAYFQKHPPRQIEDHLARELVEKYITRYGYQAIPTHSQRKSRPLPVPA